MKRSIVMMLFASMIFAAMPAQASVIDSVLAAFQGGAEFGESMREQAQQFRNRWDDNSSRREQLQEMRDALKQRLAEFQDARKNTIAILLSEQINNLNAQQSENELRFLEHLEQLLEKLNTIASRIEDRGGDISTSEAAFLDAQNTILEAKDAVLSQKETVYAVHAVSDEPIGKSFKTLIQELRTDHSDLRKNLIEPARTAVQEVVKALKTSRDTIPHDESGEDSEDDSNENES